MIATWTIAATIAAAPIEQRLGSHDPVIPRAAVAAVLARPDTLDLFVIGILSASL